MSRLVLRVVTTVVVAAVALTVGFMTRPLVDSLIQLLSTFLGSRESAWRLLVAGVACVILALWRWTVHLDRQSRSRWRFP
jgi:hypothetical protein